MIASQARVNAKATHGAILPDRPHLGVHPPEPRPKGVASTAS